MCADPAAGPHSTRLLQGRVPINVRPRVNRRQTVQHPLAATDVPTMAYSAKMRRLALVRELCRNAISPISNDGDQRSPLLPVLFVFARMMAGQQRSHDNRCQAQSSGANAAASTQINTQSFSNNPSQRSILPGMLYIGTLPKSRRQLVP